VCSSDLPGDIGATPRQTGALTSYETVVVKQAQRWRPGHVNATDASPLMTMLSR